jgi:signal transduction histidine kinase
VTVTDNGVGIAAEEQDRVFDDFFRAQASKQSGERGSGLGLAICRKIIEAHGGQLRIQRSGPAGTTFAITLPVAAGGRG